MASKFLFSRKLSYLLKNAHKPDGSRYTREEVATGIEVTPTYISKLKGGKANPTYELIKRIATFFSVKPGYFYTEQEELTASDLDIQEKSPLIGEIAMRAAQLDEAGKEAVLEMIKHIARISHSKEDDH